jgi:hypothetical protein
MISNLNNKQKQILEALKDYSGAELDLFLSTPNKYFRGRTPLEMLLNEEYTYFYQFINKSNETV